MGRDRADLRRARKNSFIPLRLVTYNQDDAIFEEHVASTLRL
jgi:hypothetical protein